MMYKIYTLDGKSLFISQVIKTEVLNHILYVEFESKLITDFEKFVFRCINKFEYHMCEDKANTIAIPMSQIKKIKKL